MNPEQNGGQLPPPNQFPQPQSPGEIPPAAPSNNPYEFIMNPQKPKKPPVLIGGNSTMQRILVVVGGLIVLVILAVVVSSLLTAGSKEKTAGLLTVAQDQTELIRIATDGTQHATTLPGQSLAQNVRASITSDNAALLDYMAKNGQKVTPIQLAAKQSKTTDATLASALENSTYDSAFKDIIQTELQSYSTALQKAYKANPGPKGQTLLSKQYDAAKLLLVASKSN
jgi:hypothetical protein